MTKFLHAKFARSLLATAGLALALTACNNAEGDALGAAGNSEVLPIIQPAEGQTWANVVSKTPEGGYVMGNPDAPIKFLEFASMTCGHCRDFAEQSFETLRDKYVNSGRVSFEIRSYLLNPYDIPATLLTQCGAPEAYFSRTEQLFENQSLMFAGLQAAGEQAVQQTVQLPEEQRFVALGNVLGLVEFFQTRGVSKAQAEDCLSNVEAVNTLVQNNQTFNEQFNITGTPTFVINGQKVELGTWTEIENRFQQMGARDQ
ncbi:thioredoxin domain-containing protein [Parasphingorhabdus sp. DH2-15]|uniref:thioredoxin domain-containing protein n=1 Tax=Parasphingorhabdus sp. DH2-15 TaxID=3444112 RepID=UPI003F68686F